MTTILSILVTLYATAFVLYLGYMGRYTATTGIKDFSRQHEMPLRLAGLVLILFAITLSAYLFGWERGTPTALFIFALAGLLMLTVSALSIVWAFRSAVIAMICSPILLGLSIFN